MIGRIRRPRRRTMINVVATIAAAIAIAWLFRNDLTHWAIRSIGSRVVGTAIDVDQVEITTEGVVISALTICEADLSLPLLTVDRIEACINWNADWVAVAGSARLKSTARVFLLGFQQAEIV